MTEKHLEEHLTELRRRVEALEARLEYSGELLSLRETGPGYHIVGGVDAGNVVVPASVLNASGLASQELLVELAVHLFKEDLISLGVAKSLAGMHTAQFMKLLASRDIPLHYDVEEFEEDVATLKRMGMLSGGIRFSDERGALSAGFAIS